MKNLSPTNVEKLSIIVKIITDFIELQNDNPQESYYALIPLTKFIQQNITLYEIRLILNYISSNKSISFTTLDDMSIEDIQSIFKETIDSNYLYKLYQEPNKDIVADINTFIILFPNKNSYEKFRQLEKSKEMVNEETLIINDNTVEYIADSGNKYTCHFKTSNNAKKAFFYLIKKIDRKAEFSEFKGVFKKPRMNSYVNLKGQIRNSFDSLREHFGFSGRNKKRYYKNGDDFIIILNNTVSIKPKIKVIFQPLPITST